MLASSQETLVEKAEILTRISQLVPMGAMKPTDPTIVSQLQRLTTALIQSYGRENLKTNPYEEVLQRIPHLYEGAVRAELEGRIVLVTGGVGCIGRHLLQYLARFGVRKVVSVDRGISFKHDRPTQIGEMPIAYYYADIRDYDALNQVFAQEKPEVVFHLAAQRNPGLGELQIRHTLTTNLFGTQNVIRLCEAHQVKKCIFSSTGKALRYFTRDVYAGSKKMAEWLFATAAANSSVTYGMVRFTHIVQNSIVSDRIEQRVEEGLVSLHAPDLNFYAESAVEAVHMLLNALIMATPGRLRFLVVRNLGWPVDLLQLALHKIVKSGKDVPLYFEGMAAGYEAHTFMGLYDRSGHQDFNPMVNVIEAQTSFVDQAKAYTVSELAPFSGEALRRQLAHLTAQVAVEKDDYRLKLALAGSVQAMMLDSFRQVNPELLLKVLRWGANPRQLKQSGIDISVHREIVESLVLALRGRVTQQTIASIYPKPAQFQELLAVLATLPNIQSEVGFLNHLITEQAA